MSYWTGVPMTAEQPEREYIITEAEITAQETLLRHKLPHLRSRPHSPAPATVCTKQCEHWYRGVGDSVIVCHKMHSQTEAQAAAKEREKVLDELIERFAKQPCLSDECCKATFLDIVRFKRQQPPEQDVGER
jgi:hypothetical protein